MSISIIVVVLYAPYSEQFARWLAPRLEDAFTSVESIQRDVPAPMLMRFFATDYGWLAGLPLFWACWALVSTRLGHASQERDSPLG